MASQEGFNHQALQELRNLTVLVEWPRPMDRQASCSTEITFEKFGKRSAVERTLFVMRRSLWKLQATSVLRLVSSATYGRRYCIAKDSGCQNIAHDQRRLLVHSMYKSIAQCLSAPQARSVHSVCSDRERGVIIE